MSAGFMSKIFFIMSTFLLFFIHFLYCVSVLDLCITSEKKKQM